MAGRLKHSVRSFIGGWRRRWLLRLCSALVLLAFVSHSASGEDVSPQTHPLMPGLRSIHLHDTEWPRTLHDNLASGFSPLVCGMTKSPRVWAQVDLGGRADWTHRLGNVSQGDRLLVYDGRLRCIDTSGEVLWTSSEGGTPAYYGPRDLNDANSERKEVLLLQGGSRLALLDTRDGQTIWSHMFEPPHVGVRVRVADIIPEMSGFEAAVLLAYGEEGCVINFPPRGEPNFVWQRQVVIPGEFDERHDHGCDIELDLSDPQHPLIWNVRRFRCRSLDARTGEIVSSLSYEIGGARRRNYGRWALGQGPDDTDVIGVVAERVQLHVHGIKLSRNGENEIAWQHYYGEVYKEAPGVALKALAIADLNRDGVTEIAYCVRDPAHDLRSFVRVRNAATGEIEYELPDHWGVAVLQDIGADQANVLLAIAAPLGAMPTRGDHSVHLLDPTSVPRHIATISGAQLPGVPTVRVGEHDEILVRQVQQQGGQRLVRYDVREGVLLETDHAESAEITDAPIVAILYDQQQRPLLVTSDASGMLTASRFDGQSVWDISVAGGQPPTLSAADLDGDGCAELLAIGPNGRLEVRSFANGQDAPALMDVEYVARWSVHSPLVCDLENNGNRCLIAPGTDEDGGLLVSAFRGDSSVVWRQRLPMAAHGVDSFVAHAGQFLAGQSSLTARTAVAISVKDSRLTSEGTFLLDGRSGEVLWHKGLYRDGAIVMPYRAHGIPTAVDINGDGVEEIGIDMLSYMAFLRGSDGGFELLRHSPNISSEDAIYAGRLYNTFLPLYFDKLPWRPHWFAKGGHGPFGLMNPDIGTGVWRVDFDYDVPRNVGMIDVDGDGDLEVGYAAMHSRTFVCRDMRTGDIEWELELASAPNAPCMSADVDGDLRGEFLIGSFCVGANEAGQGELLWQSPVALGWSIIADFDGDGQGEIACPRRGGVDILKAD